MRLASLPIMAIPPNGEFRFWTASNLIVLTGERAETVGALRDLIADCPSACLFYHTYQVLRDKHYVTDRYPNDFAQWLLTSVREETLAERFAGLDIRRYGAIAELRAEMLAILDEHIAANPRNSGREGREPFHLCRAQRVTMPTGRVAADPLTLAAEIRRAGIRSIYYHFVEARLRLHLNTNDFSERLRAWGFERTAERVNELDIYSNTLYQLREGIASLVEREVAR
jgi:Family of unknown function (DUF5752)